jgi:hypothetical protein
VLLLLPPTPALRSLARPFARSMLKFPIELPACSSAAVKLHEPAQLRCAACSASLRRAGCCSHVWPGWHGGRWCAGLQRKWVEEAGHGRCGDGRIAWGRHCTALYCALTQVAGARLNATPYISPQLVAAPARARLAGAGSVPARAPLLRQDLGDARYRAR